MTRQVLNIPATKTATTTGPLTLVEEGQGEMSLFENIEDHDLFDPLPPLPTFSSCGGDGAPGPGGTTTTTTNVTVTENVTSASDGIEVGLTRGDVGFGTALPIGTGGYPPLNVGLEVKEEKEGVDVGGGGDVVKRCDGRGLVKSGGITKCRRSRITSSSSDASTVRPRRRKMSLLEKAQAEAEEEREKFKREYIARKRAEREGIINGDDVDGEGDGGKLTEEHRKSRKYDDRLHMNRNSAAASRHRKNTYVKILERMLVEGEERMERLERQAEQAARMQRKWMEEYRKVCEGRPRPGPVPPPPTEGVANVGATTNSAHVGTTRRVGETVGGLQQVNAPDTNNVTAVFTPNMEQFADVNNGFPYNTEGGTVSIDVETLFANDHNHYHDR